jgi:hypothetical protein
VGCATVTSEFYGYSCVNMTGPSKYVTVQDSQCLDPVSVVTGGRRYSFNMGDCTNCLWQNLYTRSGRHDYVQGSEVTGPNVVVDSRSDATRADIGPHHRYSDRHAVGQYQGRADQHPEPLGLRLRPWLGGREPGGVELRGQQFHHPEHRLAAQRVELGDRQHRDEANR